MRPAWFAGCALGPLAAALELADEAPGALVAAGAVAAGAADDAPGALVAAGADDAGALPPLL